MDGDSKNETPAANRRPQSRRGTSGSAERLFALLAHALLLSGAVAAVFLTAGASQGSAGIFLVCAGAALLLCPPGVKVDGWLWLAAAALVLCASLAFLPAHWFPVPAWRKALEGLRVVPLRASITPVPYQTAFWLALLAFSALIGLFLLAQPVHPTGLLVLALAAALVCGVYAALAIYAKTTGWHYPFEAGATFGFFPNRNHTATFLITGSMLAVGVLGVTLGQGYWLAVVLAAGGLATCVSGLFFYSSSRGGIVFLLVGMLLWIVGLGRTHRNGALLVSFVSLLLAGTAFFVLSGGEAQTRLLAFTAHAQGVNNTPVVTIANGVAQTDAGPGGVADTPLDERILIYEDTFALIRSFPITGIGLGAFAGVFPQYRNVSLSEAPAVHPESDWLMLAAEAGVPALLCVLALTWLLGRRLPALRPHRNWPLRWGCVTAAAAALLHGLVDVPAHRVSLGWWILVLVGLGLQPGRTKVLGRSPIQHLVFVLGGVAMFILGQQLIRAEWFGARALPPFDTEQIQAGVVRAYEHHNTETAVRLNHQAIVASPLMETLYYQWGALELPYADSTAEVDATFKVERLLEPGSPAIPLRQGQAWLPYDPERTVALWRDALGRRERIDRTTGTGPAATVNFYHDLLVSAAKWPEVQRGMLTAANHRPALVVVWLESAEPGLVREQVERFSKDDGFTRQLDADERRRLLLAWYAAGDRGSLARFVEGHDDWQSSAWPVRLRQWIDTQQFERAVHEAASHYQISLALPAPSPERGFTGEPEQERRDPVAAFNAYWRAGNTVAAQRVLHEAISGGAQRVPPEIWRLQAAAAAQNQDWAAAWQSLQQYIRASYRDGSL